MSTRLTGLYCFRDICEERCKEGYKQFVFGQKIEDQLRHHDVF